MRSHLGGSPLGQHANVVPGTAQSEYYLRSVVQEALVALGADGPAAGLAMKRTRLVRLGVPEVNWVLPGLRESRKIPVVVVRVQAEESSPGASDARWLVMSLEGTTLAVVI
jgi:hypothetical protein